MRSIAYLESLRSKPEAERKRILIVATTLITFVIGLIWFVHTMYIISDQVLSPIATEEVVIEVDNSPSWISEQVNRVKIGWGVVIDKLSGR